MLPLRTFSILTLPSQPGDPAPKAQASTSSSSASASSSAGSFGVGLYTVLLLGGLLAYGGFHYLNAQQQAQ